MLYHKTLAYFILFYFVESGNYTEVFNATEFPTLEKCLTDPIDITIIIDGNILKGPTDIRHDLVKSIQSLLSYFGNDRVGLLTFHTNKIIQIDNKIYTTELTFIQTLKGVKIDSGNFSLANALNETLTSQMTLTNGMRLSAVGIVLVLVSEIEERDVESAVRKARVLHEYNIRVIAMSLFNSTHFTKFIADAQTVLNFDMQTDRTWSLDKDLHF